MLKRKPYAVKGGQIQEVDDEEVEYEIPNSSSFFSTHANLIPLQSAVQAPRLFYGARFYNQALPLRNAEAPLVQNLDPSDAEGRSFDQILGRNAGAFYAEDDDEGSEVLEAAEDHITLRTPNGEEKVHSLYHNFPFNRKTASTQTPVVKPGDILGKKQLLARSNFTDDKGTLAMGLNARVGLVPYKGHSFEDAVVISESFAKRMESDHSYTVGQSYEHSIKGGKEHYTSLFPTTYSKEQLKNLDDDGVVKVGTTVQSGDPLVLATRPRVFSSTTSKLGSLSKAMRQSRHDAAKLWEDDHPGIVTDVAKTKKGVKVQVSSTAPTHVGDKVVFRSGQKGVVSTIIPDDHMPRTLDGTPLEVLLNPLGIPSRANNSMIYELLLGKIAAKKGEPYRMSGFNSPEEKWHEMVQKALDENGMSDTEEVFDPVLNKKLGQPVTVGMGYMLKLHHTSASKSSARGQGGYDCYSADTEVLTKRGWVAWPAATMEDEFYTIDALGTAVYTKPDKLVAYSFAGDLIGFKSKYIDVLTTPNHEHYVGRTPRTKKFSKVEAYKLFNKSRHFKFKQFGFTPTEGHTPDITIIPGVVTQTEYRKNTYPPIKLPTCWFSVFLGWFISEGHLQVETGAKKRYRITIWQSSVANEDKCKDIEKCLQELGLTWRKGTRKSTGINFYTISSPQLACYLLNNYGDKCTNKRIAREVFQWDAPTRRLLFDAYMHGDGSNHNYTKNDGRIKPNKITNAYTRSEQLASDLQELAVTLGFGAIISKVEGGPMPNTTYTRGPGYRVGFHVKRTEATFRLAASYSAEAYTQPYNGIVYCAHLPATGLLYVRRNNKPLLSGNSNQQPLKGSSESAQSKRLSGLEVHSMLSAGAYNNIREGATLRGQQNDEYWRALRAGQTPKPPGKPFVWDKFQALLSGTGMHARDVGGGNLRLGPFTDDELDKRDPMTVETGELVNIHTLEPVPGGLFDEALVGNNKWGKIALPFEIPNPAFEGAIRHLLGLTEKELRGVLAGTMELPERLR